MRVRNTFAAQSTLPKTIVRCRSYRNLVGQWLFSACGSAQLDDRIIEEEESDMVDDISEEVTEAPTRPNSTYRLNGSESESDQYGDFFDKEDDDDVEEANHRREPLQSTVNPVQTRSSLSDPPEIKVTTDESLSQMAHDYGENFSGFVEFSQFSNLETMHDFIKHSLESSASSSGPPENKQELYLDILLNEQPENRFFRLLDNTNHTIRRLLLKNEDLLRDLFESASLDNFPSPLGPIDDNEALEDNDSVYENNQDDLEVNENMKRWYMIEMIGLWLKMITNITDYRRVIKINVLKKSCGIENDEYEGIAMPLKYK